MHDTLSYRSNEGASEYYLRMHTLSLTSLLLSSDRRAGVL